MIDYRLGNVDLVLDGIPDETVQCCVTSPPYFGLRSYDGGTDEIGQEDTPEAFVARLVEVFRKVRRVLRKDGVLFLNLGDSWATTPKGNPGARGNINGGKRDTVHADRGATFDKSKIPGFPPKNLLGIPWRVALALQADGWYLRQDLIWSKTACMPESVTDRFTKSHEYIFLLSKSDRYFFDHVAVREPTAESTRSRLAQNVAAQKGSGRVPGKTNGTMKAVGNGETRNRRSVWSIKLRGLGHRSSRRSVLVISPKGFKGAHFAVYPPEIPEIAIKAGTSAHGACAACGAPWKRQMVPIEVVAKDVAVGGDPTRHDGGVRVKDPTGRGGNVLALKRAPGAFAPTCRCNVATVRPCVVLDPFGGSGTTSMVAEQLGRDSIYIDLNPEYLAIAMERWRLA